MYINVAYLNNMLESYLTPVDCEDFSVPLKILCCGFYRVTVNDTMIETNRPNGRKDYQLLYFHSGRGHFSFREDNSVRETETGKIGQKCPDLVTAGQFVLFRPSNRQVYEYYASDRTEVYWVHFTGSDAEHILRQFGFEDSAQVFWSGVSMEYQNLFRKMIKELQLCRKNYETIIACRFQELLALAGRNRYNPYIAGSSMETIINDALIYFDENYAKPINVNDYAASVYISPCWFIRCFRNYMGMTPLQYIIHVRISNARELLLNPDFSIAEVSRSVGYEDPLYFSRYFKRSVGISPKDYKKSLHTAESGSPQMIKDY
ncbi:MAG: AraC family transcriptional regulator [Enterocloster citroniae]|nr:AraC family transcriptional regulator [Enterocloster citroniae]